MKISNINLYSAAASTWHFIAEPIIKALFIAGFIWIGAKYSNDPLDMTFVKFWLLLSAAFMGLKFIGSLFKSKVGA